MDVYGEWSVNISIDTDIDTADIFMYVEFVEADAGTNFTLTDDQRAAFEKAVESGEAADAIAAQGALVDDVLTWFEQEWLDGFNYRMICRLERDRLGISKDDIEWQASFVSGPEEMAVRVYEAGDDKFLVCYESLSTPDTFDDTHIEPFSLITQEQFEEVPFDPTDERATNRAFLEVSGMIQK